MLGHARACWGVHGHARACWGVPGRAGGVLGACWGRAGGVLGACWGRAGCVLGRILYIYCTYTVFYSIYIVF